MENEEYRFDICPTCEYRDGSLNLCNVCDEGSHYEEAEFGDDDEPYLKRVIRIKVAA